MYPLNAFLASALSLWLWPLPEFDYWAYWSEQSMRSKVLPNIAGW